MTVVVLLAPFSRKAVTCDFISVAATHIRERLCYNHLAKGNRLSFVALGNSMWPAIRSGDLVHIEHSDNYRLQDVLFYQREDRWFVHRFVGYHQVPGQITHWLLKGDSLPVHDQPVAPQMIMGRVVKVERKGQIFPRCFRKKQRPVNIGLPRYHHFLPTLFCIWRTIKQIGHVAIKH